jgi:uncharacterized protein (TIGR02271 family)
MQRAVTAIYPSADVAQLVRRELTELGVGNHDITILPDLDGSSTFGGDPVDRLHNLGLPEEDMRTYQQAIRNGDYVVSVEVDREDDLSRIQEIMRRPEDAYDLDQLDTQYADSDFIPRQQAAYADTGSMGQQGGYGASGLGAAGMAAGAMGGMGMGSDNLGTSDRAYRDEDYNEDGTLKVVEERLNVGKRDVDQGAVRLRSYVREVPVEAEVDLRATRVYVERHPVDRAVSPGDIGMRDQVIEAREHAEQAVVGKEARVVEEIGLRQETEVQHERIQDTVRKTEVEIEDERTGRTGLSGGTDRDRSGY